MTPFTPPPRHPMHAIGSARPRECRVRLWAALLFLFLLVVAPSARAQGLRDVFADRETVTSAKGNATGNNALAGLEPLEPRHGGKPGGHSVWLSWVAPATGIATVATDGSNFDTLLSVYEVDPSNPDKPVMDRLRRVALSDDDVGVKTSLVQFGAIAGTRYEIAVDGYAGATGDIHLRWDLVDSGDPLPIILQMPADRALQVGDTLVLSVDVQAGKDVKIHWYFNEVEIPGEDSTVLTIPNFQRSNVGRYRIRLTSGKVRFFSEPIELQINSEGEIDTLARDKLFDSVGSALIGRGGPDDQGGNAAAAPLGRRRAAPAGPIGDSRGFNGTQIFNTSFALSDPDEPVHCGVPGGASYWLSYIAPADGPLTLDTDGSDFDTVLAVYSYSEPLLGYQSLVPVGCDDNAGANGRTSRARVDVQRGKTYFIVVDGVAGARGIAHLNYQLPKPVVDVAPQLTSAPSSTNAVAGSRLVWEAAATGTPPPSFTWLKDGSPLEGQTNATLVLDPVRPEDEGSYTVSATNRAGSASSQPIALAVIVPPSLPVQPLPQSVILGQELRLEVVIAGTPPHAIVWYRDDVRLEAQTNALLRLESITAADGGVYRVAVTNAAGSARSDGVLVTVLVPPRIRVQPPLRSTIGTGQPVTLGIEVEGTAPFTFAWFRDGKPMDGANSPTLHIPGALHEHAARYHVEVTNAAGKAVSDPADLVVLDPPSVRLSPAHLSLPAGASLTLEAAVEGSTPIQWVWRRNGIVIEGVDNAVLHLDSVAARDAGAYSVEAINAVGSALSEVSRVSVIVPASIRFDPAGSRVVLGSPAAPGQAYALESTDNPEVSAWHELASGIAGDGGVELSQPADAPAARFFRFRFD